MLGLADRAGDLHDALAEAGEILMVSTPFRFVQGVAPDGAPWVPLAPSTLAQKKGPGILRENLHLMGSFRYQMLGQDLHFGTNVPYAAAQHFGLPVRTTTPKHGKALAWPGGKHPVSKVNPPGLKARPFVGLSTEDEERILEAVADYLAAE